MDKTVIVFGCTVAYIVITTLVGMWSVRKTRDTESFMTGKKQLGYWVVGLLLMSEFIGPGATVGTAQGAYAKGISVAWNTSTLALGYWLYAYYLAPKMNAMGEYTISGALAKHYGTAVRMLVAVTMSIALTTVNVAVYTGGAAALGKLLDTSIETAIFIIAVCATLNVTFGGIRGVGYANIIHTTFKYMGLIVIAGSAWFYMKGQPSEMVNIPATHFSLFEGVGLGQVFAWSIANIGAVFSTQYVLQSISSLPTPADARKATMIAGIAILPIGFLAAFIGVMAKGVFPNIPSVMALPAFFDVMNPWLVGVAASAMIAATFVTILACQLGATALIMKDFYNPLVKPNEKHSIWATRIIAVIIGFLPIPFALFVPGMIKTFFFARALRSVITVLVLFMIYKPHMASKNGGAIALFASVVVVAIWAALGNPFGIDNIYVAIVMPTAILLIDNIMFRASRNRKQLEASNE